MIYGSVCTGIGAAEQAWNRRPGWRCAFMSEIDPFPRAVLQTRHPEVPLHGDFTTIQDGDYEPIDLLVGGTPCQGLSVAGRRGGFRDGRSVLALEYSRLADRLRPKWVAWENVPGAFTTKDDEDPDAIPGEDFAAFLSSLARWSVDVPPGGWQNSGVVAAGPVDGAYGLAWRVLDAQYVRTRAFPAAVPQRRRRVFVVGYLGDWRPPAAVLLEPESLQGHPPPRREAGQGSTAPVAPRLTGSGRGVARSGESRGQDPLVAHLATVAFGGNNTAGPIDVATAVNAHGGPMMGRMDFESETFMVHAFDARQNEVVQYGPITGPLDTDGYSDAVAFAVRGREDGAVPEVEGDGSAASALRAASGGSSRDYVAFDTTQMTSKANRSNPKPGDPCHPLTANGDPPAIAFSMKDSGQDASEGVAPTLRAAGHDESHQNSGAPPAVAFTFSALANKIAWESDVNPTLNASPPNDTNGIQYGIRTHAGVRRLTPLECSRLQAFPDDFAQVPYRGKNAAPDGPMYKSYGNSMAVNVMDYLGERIDMVDKLVRARG